VEAARTLIREKGGSGFSMRELAAKAGVSYATPYNLLSSKTNLLTLVVQEEFALFRHKMNLMAPTSGLDRLLAIVDLLATHYADDQAFYFGFFAAAGTAGEGSLGPVLQEQARTLFRGLVQTAVADEDNTQNLDLFMLTDILLRTLRATVEAWYVAGWSTAHFQDVFAYSARVVLLPALKGFNEQRVRSELSLIQTRFTEQIQNAA